MTDIPSRSDRTTSVPAGAKPGARLLFLDNLRIYLTILVIFHHAALAYGGAGDWAIRDPAVDDISPLVLTLFNALNQSYFMTAFFLLAGYFTPRSLDTKGPKSFVIDRLIRLGVPLLVYTTLIININGYIIDIYGSGVPYHLRIGYDAGHLWFLQALLIFADMYVIFRVLTDQSATSTSLQFYRDTFPPEAVLFLSIAILAILTFMVRLVFRVGVWFLKVQPAHFVHYIFAFYIGILAYYVNIFEDPELREALKDYSNWPTYPQVYISGELVGGCDIMTDLYQQGELAKMLEAVNSVVE